MLRSYNLLKVIGIIYFLTLNSVSHSSLIHTNIESLIPHLSCIQMYTFSSTNQIFNNIISSFYHTCYYNTKISCHNTNVMFCLFFSKYKYFDEIKTMVNLANFLSFEVLDIWSRYLLFLDHPFVAVHYRLNHSQSVLVFTIFL